MQMHACSQVHTHTDKGNHLCMCAMSAKSLRLEKERKNQEAKICYLVFKWIYLWEGCFDGVWVLPLMWWCAFDGTGLHYGLFTCKEDEKRGEKWKIKEVGEGRGEEMRTERRRDKQGDKERRGGRWKDMKRKALEEGGEVRWGYWYHCLVFA